MVTVVHEPACQRLNQRIAAMLLVEIDGHSYRTANWSLGGFALHDYHRENLLDSLHVARLIIPYQGFELAFVTEVRLQRKENNICAFCFTDLDARKTEILKHFIASIVSGEMTSMGDTIARMDIPVTPVNISPSSATNASESSYARKLAIPVLFLLLGLPLLTWLISGFYGQLFHLEVRTAMIGAPIETLYATASGQLSKVSVKLGDKVQAQQTIAQISDMKVAESIELAEINIRSSQLALQEQVGRLNAQLHDMQQYRSFGNKALLALYSKVGSLKQQLDLASVQRDRAKSYEDQGIFAKTEVEQTESRYAALESELDSAKAEVAVSEEALDSIKSGRYYTENKLTGDVPELRVMIANLKGRISLEKESKAVLEKQQAHTLRAPFDGIILKSYSSVGTGVEQGKPLFLVARSDERVVHAYLTEEEASFLQPGAIGKVIDSVTTNIYYLKVTEIASVNNTGDDLVFRSQWREHGDRSVHAVLTFLDNKSANFFATQPHNTPVTVTFTKNPLKTTLTRLKLLFKS